MANAPWRLLAVAVAGVDPEQVVEAEAPMSDAPGSISIGEVRIHVSFVPELPSEASSKRIF
jgi:hypothetical protein